MITEQQLEETFNDLENNGSYQELYTKINLQLERLKKKGRIELATNTVFALGFDVSKMSDLEILYIYSTLP